MSLRLKASERNPDAGAPEEVFQAQVVLDVPFWSFADRRETGRIVVHEDVADDVLTLFDELVTHRFPLESVIPVHDPRFAWDDEASMAANNTSAYNYRTIAGTDRLSYHALGKAIDLNPALNPYEREDIVQPPGAVYRPGEPGVIVEGDFVTELMDDLGWEWGGRWSDRKDYQHFQKV